MPPIRLDHIAIALPRIADAPSVLVAVLGGVPERMRPAGAFRWASWTYAGGGCIAKQAGLPGARSPVRILGLRMRAHSRERALTQWRDMEGPLAIELATGRGLAGLNEASARLGIQLAQRPGI